MVTVSIAISLLLDAPVSVTQMPDVSIRRDWIDYATWAAGVVLTAVGVWGIVVASRSLRAIKRQSELMNRNLRVARRQALSMRRQTTILRDSVKVGQAAAEASLRSAEAVMNAERGRLIESLKFLAGARLELSVINSGRSPVRLTHVVIKKLTLNSGEGEPQPDPDYSNGDTRDEWILPGADPTSVGFESLRELYGQAATVQISAVQAGEITIWIYGMLRYFETVTNKDYELRFCYRMEFIPNSNPHPCPAGPEAYRGERDFARQNSLASPKA